VPEDDCQQVDTSAQPVKHPSRVRGADQWTGPGNDLAARFGCDAAHAEWFYGFRLAIKTDLGSRIVRAWSIVPAAVNERDVAAGLLELARHGAHSFWGTADSYRSHHRGTHAAARLPRRRRSTHITRLRFHFL